MDPLAFLSDDEGEAAAEALTPTQVINLCKMGC